MPRSPEPARRQILDAALRLFARNGITGTSLREVRLAAKQGNAGALHYHFGDKAGLLRALLERELPLLVERRKALLSEATDVRSVAAVFVLPFAQLATGTEHEREVVQLLSELHDDVSLSIEDIADLIGDTGTKEAYVLLRERVVGVRDEVLRERVRVGVNGFLHAAAVWARGERRAHEVSDELFRANLVDMFLGAVTVGALDT
jgi:AcrR family transcriptional regulator